MSAISLRELADSNESERRDVISQQDHEHLLDIQTAISLAIDNLKLGLRDTSVKPARTVRFDNYVAVARPDLMATPEYQVDLRTHIEKYETLLQEVRDAINEEN
jgi:hypothetical protein